MPDALTKPPPRRSRPRRIRHLPRLAVPALPALSAGGRPAARRSTQLVEGISDGLSFQTLLGVTGSGKTFTMANVIARHRPAGARLRAQQDAGRAALQRVPRVLPEERGRVLRQLLRLLPARGLRAAARPVHREGQRDQRAHRADAPVGDQEPARAARRGDRGQRVSAIYGIGEPEDYHQMVMTLRVGDKLGQRDVIAQLIRMQYTAQRDRLLARHVPRARRHDRRLPGRALASWRSASSCSTTRSSRCSCSTR